MYILYVFIVYVLLHIRYWPIYFINKMCRNIDVRFNILIKYKDIEIYKIYYVNAVLSIKLYPQRIKKTHHGKIS